MRKLISTLIIFLFAITLHAQPFTYSGYVYGSNGQGLSNVPVSLYGKRIAPYEISFPTYSTAASYTTGTVIPSSDDVTHGPFNIGFTFTYFGNNYTQFYVGSNGWIGFTANQTTGYTAAFIPNASSPLNAILADWEDLLPGSSNIRYTTIGTSPNRKLVVSFNQVPHYSCNTNLHTFQFVLFEGSNVIEINYLSKPLCGSNNATAGLISTVYSTVVPVGGKNASTWNVSNYSVRFTPSSPETSYTLKGMYNTNSNGQYSIVPNLDDASHDFQIRLEGLTIAAPSTTDATIPLQIVFGTNTPNSKKYYQFDVNSDTRFSVTDTYCIYGRISGRFITWPSSTPSYRIFTPSQWSIINSGSTDLRSTYPGVQSIIITPVNGGSSNFYLIRTGYPN
jgi:hypothetical protein